MPLTDNILPDASRAPTMEMIVRARSMYVEKFAVSRILAFANMSLGTLYYWLDGGPRDESGKPMLDAIPRRRQVIGKRKGPLSADRASLAARLLRTATRQAREIELRLAQPSAATPERERDVRMLALLVRSLRDLSGWQGTAETAREAHAAEPELARKLAREGELREAEERAALVRHLLSYLRDVRKIEQVQRGRAGAAAKAQEEIAQAQARNDELRARVARSIEGMVAAQRVEREPENGGRDGDGDV